MTRDCDSCGEAYEAKRSTSKFCKPICRKRNARVAATAPAGEVVAASSVLDSVLAELVTAGREKTSAGQAALVLARRVDRSFDTGSALAALVRELRTTLAAAVAGANVEATPLQRAKDELAARRARRGA